MGCVQGWGEEGFAAGMGQAQPRHRVSLMETGRFVQLCLFPVQLCPALTVSRFALPGSAVPWMGCDLPQFQCALVQLVPVQPFPVELCPASVCSIPAEPIPVQL